MSVRILEKGVREKCTLFLFISIDRPCKYVKEKADSGYLLCDKGEVRGIGDSYRLC